MLHRRLRGLGDQGLVILTGGPGVVDDGLGSGFPLRSIGPTASPLRHFSGELLRRVHLLGLLLFQGQGADGMAAAACFGAVAMAGAGGHEGFGKRRGNGDVVTRRMG